MTVDLSKRLENGWAIREAFIGSVCPKGARALDIGCGRGEYTLPLARIAASVDAVDTSGAEIAELRAACERFGVSNVTAVAADLVTWGRDKPPRSYDFIMFSLAIYLLSARERAVYLAELARLLAPDGVMFVDFPTPRFIAYRLLIQNLTIGQRLHSLAWFLRGRLTGRNDAAISTKAFLREISAAGLRAEDNREMTSLDSKWAMCRLIEGNDFNTWIGVYFAPFVVHHA